MSEKRIHEFLAGGGEMGERIRNFDWSKTSLGKPEQWPQELKTCVRIMLSSQQPIWIGWGKELIKLYNDTYIDIVRGKHPVALGQPASVVWKDIWKDISPLLSKAMLKDEGTYVESQLLIMHRSGFPEETYYTFSYTPVLGDDDKPAGIICYNTTDTERIINERSLKTLQQLDSLVQKKTELEVYIQAAKAIEFNKWDFPFSIIYKINDDGNTADLVATAGFAEKYPTLPDSIDVSKPTAYTENFCKAVTENRLVESENNGRWGDLPKGAWDIEPHRFIHMPIKGANRKFPLAVLSIGLNPYRQFDEVYKNFIQLTADQISLGVNNAIAYEEERKRAQVLEELDKAKTLFFSNISHEFRTPITLMLGPLEELLNKPDIHLSAYERQHVEVTHRNALRLLKLVNTLLDFSRIESGRHEAHFVPTDLSAYTKNLASNFRSVMEKAGLELVVNAATIKEPVYIDKQMYEKIVFNLLSNAFKYTLQGKVIVNLSAGKREALLTVEDTGVGIPAKEIPHMFDRFHRVQNTAGRTYEGTGIGLSLVKELVQLHKGQITVESKEGTGSKFSVSIPLGKSHLPETQVQETPDFSDIISNVYVDEAASFLQDKTEKATSKQKDFDKSLPTILIVDDNTDMRQHIESIISTKYNTLIAANGAEALQLIRQRQPSLILSDIMMPVMDGIELLKEVKENSGIAHIPVVLITARAGEESRIEGYETGADDYMTKPFSANELLSRVKSQLKIAQTRREVEQRLRGFLMQAPAAIAILEGPEHRFSLTNTRFQELIGRQSDEMVGHSLRQLFPEFEGQGIFEIFSYVHSSGEPFAANEFFASFMYKGKIRSGYWDFVIYPIKNENGLINELMVHVIESTAQVEARKKVEASEEQFRTLAETLPQLVWMTDAKGNQLYASGRWLEYTGIESSAENWILTLHPDDYKRMEKAWHHSLSTGDIYKIELRLKNKAGEYRWHYGQGEPVRNEQGEIINWIGTFMDIHEQKIFTEKLETLVEERTAELSDKNVALENSNKELESFNYIASHDLQEPLRKIRTFIHLIEKSGFESENGQKYFEKINSSAQRMSDLIQSVLTYSRLSKTGEEFVETDLNKILAEVKTDFELLIKEKNATIKSSKLPVIKASSLQINQLFSNLISNSLKFSTEKPRISISSKIVKGKQINSLANPDQSFVHLIFKDNGIGFPEEFKEKIFNLFQRLHGKSEYSGTGIGLSIVKKIVEQHKGFISAESKDGEGAVFNIWLPV